MDKPGPGRPGGQRGGPRGHSIFSGLRPAKIAAPLKAPSENPGQKGAAPSPAQVICLKSGAAAGAETSLLSRTSPRGHPAARERRTLFSPRRRFSHGPGRGPQAARERGSRWRGNQPSLTDKPPGLPGRQRAGHTLLASQTLLSRTRPRPPGRLYPGRVSCIIKESAGPGRRRRRGGTTGGPGRRPAPLTGGKM